MKGHEICINHVNPISLAASIIQYEIIKTHHENEIVIDNIYIYIKNMDGSIHYEANIIPI